MTKITDTIIPSDTTIVDLNLFLEDFVAGNPLRLSEHTIRGILDNFRCWCQRQRTEADRLGYVVKPGAPMAPPTATTN